MKFVSCWDTKLIGVAKQDCIRMRIMGWCVAGCVIGVGPLILAVMLILAGTLVGYSLIPAHTDR